jgi:hypothetical protein
MVLLKKMIMATLKIIFSRGARKFRESPIHLLYPLKKMKRMLFKARKGHLNLKAIKHPKLLLQKRVEWE